MIHVTRITIGLPKEAVINCNIRTDETLDQFRKKIIDDLKKYNISATIEITSRDTTPSLFSASTLRQHLSSRVRTEYGDGKLLEVLDDISVKIKAEGGRMITLPASKVTEVLEG